MEISVIRRIDDLGRIVIPRAIREKLGIKEGEPLTIGLDDKGRIVISRYAILEAFIAACEPLRAIAAVNGIDIQIYDDEKRLTDSQTAPFMRINARAENWAVEVDGARFYFVLYCKGSISKDLYSVITDTIRGIESKFN